MGLEATKSKKIDLKIRSPEQTILCVFTSRFYSRFFRELSAIFVCQLAGGFAGYLPKTTASERKGDASRAVYYNNLLVGNNTTLPGWEP